MNVNFTIKPVNQRLKQSTSIAKSTAHIHNVLKYRDRRIKNQQRHVCNFTHNESNCLHIKYYVNAIKMKRLENIFYENIRQAIHNKQGKL